MVLREREREREREIGHEREREREKKQVCVLVAGLQCQSITFQMEWALIIDCLPTKQEVTAEQTSQTPLCAQSDSGGRPQRCH